LTAPQYLSAETLEVPMSRVRSLAVFCAVLLAGCYSYRAVPLASIQPKHVVRVTPRSGRRVLLTHVRVSGDTLRGLKPREEIDRTRFDTVAMTEGDILKVEVRHTDVPRSIATGALVVVGMAGVVLAVEWNHIGGPM
jgi:hypothetical protein